MSFRTLFPRVGLASLLLLGVVGSGSVAAADTVQSGPRLIISSFKATTDSKFITLYNASTMPLNLGNVTLNYYTYDTAKDTGSSPATYRLTDISSTHSLQLSGTLAPGSYYIVNDGLLSMCYQAAVDSASLSFSTTAGSLQILDANGVDGTSITAAPTVDDSIGWSKYATSNISDMQLLPGDPAAFLQRDPADTTWKDVVPTDPADVCGLSELLISPGTGTVSPADDWELPTEADIPASIEFIAAAAPEQVGPYVPATDVGLAAPQLTELLPNPAGTGTDATDEFIELYNPNARTFDLSGFVLQTGLTTKHSYMFPAGTMLPAKAFKAFSSSDTSLALSNSGGQADLTDPFGKVISQTDPYDSAKDGQAWAFAKGTWYWTGKPTPGAANVVNQSGASIKTTSAKKAAAAVKGASTTTGLQGQASQTASAADQPAATHPYVLVAVAALAVGYVVYEYRHDIGNYLHKLRANRNAR